MECWTYVTCGNFTTIEIVLLVTDISVVERLVNMLTSCNQGK